MAGGAAREDAAEKRRRLRRQGAAGEGAAEPAPGPAGFAHVPVMVPEVLRYLRPAPGETVVDATVGGGGHAEAVLPRLAPGGRLVALDRDPEACAAARERLGPLAERLDVRLHVMQTNFVHLEAVLDKLGIAEVDGVLFDLGVSSAQLDVPGRGFSYREDAPLDMRMDPTQGTSAYHLVNGLDERELAELIGRLGEERWARRIAAAIVRWRRERGLITTTGELVAAIKSAVPAGARQRRDGPHPARRTFQALRIAVNNELGVLQAALPAAVRRLRPGGRIVVLAYHSLEDRIVKHVLREMAAGCTCPPEQPACSCGRRPAVRLLLPRPLVPTEAERAANPRARSAKLRAAVRAEGEVPGGPEGRLPPPAAEAAPPPGTPGALPGAGLPRPAERARAVGSLPGGVGPVGAVSLAEVLGRARRRPSPVLGLRRGE